MKNRMMKFIRKNGFVIWIIVAALALASLPVYAAYMRTQTAKRVISTMAGVGNRFSSNRLATLETNASELEFRFITVTGETPAEGIRRELTICNYPQGLEASFYPYDISYTVQMELTDNLEQPPVFENEALALTQYYVQDTTGTTRYFTKDTQTGKYMLSISEQSLKGNRASTNVYTLVFPDKDTGVYMKAFVSPQVKVDNNWIQPSDLKAIGAMISAVSVSGSTDNNWIGELTEPRESGKNVSDYDAFNYVVTGSGAGTITLKWKANMLEINPFYSENEGIAGTITGTDDNGYNSLIFTVTADQTKNRYSFQMYRAAESNWSSITSFSAIANESNSNSPLIIFNFTAATGD